MKKIVLSIAGLAVLVAGWYLFVKEYDYQFRFNAKYGPATVYKEIMEWDEFHDADTSEMITVIQQEPFSELVQEVKLSNGNLLRMEWEFEYLNDSVTEVQVSVSEPARRLKNRLGILNPMSGSEYLNSLKSRFLQVNRELAVIQDTYKISPAGTAVSPALDCACITSESSVEGKARAMTATVTYLQDYLEENDLHLQGFPMLKVNKWDFQKNRISFDFCFPIKLRDDLQETRLIKLKHFDSSSSLFAIFRGNYRLSHFAWFDLYEKARRENRQITALPMEIYHDNPMMGSKEDMWRADVYLPLRTN
ncbi:MAG: hypothetical protein WAM00_03315 [Salegentibacter sp.]